MASYEQVVKLENEKPDGVIRLVKGSGLRCARVGRGQQAYNSKG